MEFSALDQERRVPGLGGDLRPEGRDARRGAPQPLAADVGGDALVEHGGDVLAPPDAVAHVRRGEVLQRGVRQRRDAPFESLRRFAAPRVDVNRVFEDLFVLLPSREARDLVAAHQDRELHPRPEVFLEVTQGIYCV